MGLVHAASDDQSRCRGQRRNHPDGVDESEPVGDDTGQQSADRETSVAPESVDADGRSPPARVSDVTDNREQRRIHHRGADPEDNRGERPGGESMTGGNPSERNCLDQHPSDDQ